MRLNLDIFRLRSEGVETLPRRRSTVLLGAGLILVPAVSFAILANAPLLAWLAAPPALAALIPKRSLPLTARSLVYSLVVGVLVVFILNQTYTVDTDRFFLPVELSVPFGLTVAICMLYLDQRRILLVGIATLALLVLVVQGGCLSDPPAIKIMLWRGVGSRYLVYAVATSLEVALLLGLLPRLQGRRLVLGQGGNRRRRLAYAGGVLLLLFTSVVFCWSAVLAYQQADPFFNRMFMAILRLRAGRQHFPDAVDLNRTVQPKSPDHLRRVVLRARAPAPPGYLRARAYRDYRDGRWQSDSAGDNLPRQNLPGNDTLRRYRLDPDFEVGPDAWRLEVLPAASFHSNVLFAPGNAAAVDLVSNSLARGVDGILRPTSEWATAGGYTLYLPGPPRPVWPEPTDPAADAYLQVPPELAAALDRILAARRRADDPRDPVLLVQSYLLGNAFEYELGARLPGGKDPVLGFLEDARRGHCELFASAATLLLRRAGVPARYVTGVVCAEPHPRADYYLARNIDLHAWVEYFDGERGAWRLLEATPAIGVPGGEDRSGFWSGLREYLHAWWAQLWAQVQRGQFAAAVWQLLAGLGGLMAWLFWSGPWYLAWPLLLAALACWWWRWRRRRRPRHLAVPPEYRQLHGLLRRLEKHLARYRLERPGNASLGDLERLCAGARLPEAAAVSRFIAQYQRLRYRPGEPAAADLEALRQHLRAVVQPRRRRPV